MQDDGLTYIQLFWNSVDTALTSTLHSQKVIGEYKDLTGSSSIFDVLVPPQVNADYKTCKPAYDQLSRMLRNHLLKQGTIPVKISLRSFHTLTKYKIEEDGFNLLTKVFFNGRPQLGGEERYLYIYVATLQIYDGEKLVNNTCCLCGPSYNIHKGLRERLNQYNLKHKSEKKLLQTYYY